MQHLTFLRKMDRVPPNSGVSQVDMDETHNTVDLDEMQDFDRYGLLSKDTDEFQSDSRLV